MRLKTCFRSETFPGIDIKWFAADRANAVSFVKTQNLQTLFSSSAFSNTSVCGGARGGREKFFSTNIFSVWKWSLSNVHRDMLVGLMLYLKLECFPEFCYFSIFSQRFGGNFLFFQEKCFPLVFGRMQKAASKRTVRIWSCWWSLCKRVPMK